MALYRQLGYVKKYPAAPRKRPTILFPGRYCGLRKLWYWLRDRWLWLKWFTWQ